MKKLLCLLLICLTMIGCVSCGDGKLEGSKGLYYGINSDETYTVMTSDPIFTSNIVIPELHKGNKVTVISNMGNAKNLNTITISSNIDQIEEGAFLECEGLNAVFYIGTKEEWEQIEIGRKNDPLCEARKYYEVGESHKDKNEDSLCDNCKGECPFISVLNVYTYHPQLENSEYEDSKIAPILNSVSWEPGYYRVVNVRIENTTDKKVDGRIQLISPSENISHLSEAIEVFYYDTEKTTVSRNDLVKDSMLGTVKNLCENNDFNPSISVQGNESKTVTLVFKMKESAGNEYQNTKLNKLFVNVLAD